MEMKCWVCDGLGVTYKSKSRLSAYAVRKETCTRCNGTGEIQTNEEWFCNLPTKEKAKVFYDFRKGGRISWRINEILMDIHDVIMDGYEDITPLKAIEIWLKEEHRDEA